MLKTPLGGFTALCALLLGVGQATSGERRAGQIERVEHRESSMVRIPAGSFFMGFPRQESEVADIKLDCVREFGLEAEEWYCKDEFLWGNSQDSRVVYLPAYEIDRYEVAAADYRTCAEAGGCDVIPLLTAAPEHIAGTLPMVNVTWRDATDYCAWAGKRLPTEAEWEKAARGTSGQRWPWGNHERVDGSNHGAVSGELVRMSNASVLYTHDASDGALASVPSGSMPWTSSPYGVYDMAGNVSEWVADYYRETYAGLTNIAPVVEAPPSANAAMRVYRGGSWAEPRLLGRTYFRAAAEPDLRSFDRGFRCARAVDEEE